MKARNKPYVEYILLALLALAVVLAVIGVT